MKKTQNPFSYPGRPIGSVSALAAHLGLTTEELARSVSRAGPESYREVFPPEGEPGGRLPAKVTYDTHYWLKVLQKRINKRILSRIAFPSYVVGGVPGRQLRDAVSIHKYARSLMTFDVVRFFETARVEEVIPALMVVLRCPSEVAEALVALSSIHGHLPRGAPTSTYLANLMLAMDEPRLVAQLNELAPYSFRYSRWIDDMTITSTEPLTADAISQVTGMVSAMLSRRGLEFAREKGVPREHRRKRRVVPDADAVLVHNIEVRGTRLIVPKEKRREIRAGVNSLRMMVDTRGQLDAEGVEQYRSLSSRVGYMQHFGHKDILMLRAELKRIWRANGAAKRGSVL